MSRNQHPKPQSAHHEPATISGTAPPRVTGTSMHLHRSLPNVLRDKMIGSRKKAPGQPMMTKKQEKHKTNKQSRGASTHKPSTTSVQPQTGESGRQPCAPATAACAGYPPLTSHGLTKTGTMRQVQAQDQQDSPTSQQPSPGAGQRAQAKATQQHPGKAAGQAAQQQGHQAEKSAGLPISSSANCIQKDAVLFT